MDIHRSDYLRRALFETLPTHLEPYVRRRLTDTYGSSWSLPPRSGQDDDVAGELSDLSMQIWALTGLGPNHTPILRTDPGMRSHLHEIRRARNTIAHGGELDKYQTLGTLGRVREVLTQIGADDGAAEVTAFYDAVAASDWNAPDTSPAAAPVPAPPVTAPKQPEQPESGSAASIAAQPGTAEASARGGTPGPAPTPVQTASPPAAAAPEPDDSEPDDSPAIVTPRRALLIADDAPGAHHGDRTLVPSEATVSSRPAPHDGDCTTPDHTQTDHPDSENQGADPLAAVRVDVSFSPIVSYAQAVAGLPTPITVGLSLLGGSDGSSTRTPRAETPDAETPSGPATPPDWRAASEDDEEHSEVVHRLVGPAPGARRDRIAGIRVEVVVESEGTGLTEPWHFGVDVLTAPVERSADIRLDRTELLQMTAQADTTVRIRLETDGGSREMVVDGPTVLAARQWRLRDSVGSAARSLATFVQPQQTELPALWRRAADHLQDATGSSSLSGYQDSPERVDATVQALCDAIVERDIAYSAPPTNWSDEGQRIRTAEEVLDGRLATCLDTTILMAGALEYVDIQPLVVVLDGHALLGYWRTDHHGVEPIAASGPSLVNLIDRGDLGLVETTLLTSTTGVDLTALHRSARRTMLPDGSAVFFAVSVHEARGRGIAALPARGHDESGQAVEVSFTPADRPIIAAEPAPQATVHRAPSRPKGPVQVEKWKRELLDLSLRNRLINCPDSAVRRHAIVRLDVPASLTGRLEDLVSGGATIHLSPAPEQVDAADETFLSSRLLEGHEVVTDLSLDVYDSSLQKIAADARTLIEETGANNLFLAVGSLVWRSGERDLRSPLILIPVELHRKSRKSLYTMKLDTAGSSTPNFSLLERLKVDLGLQIPGLEDPEEDDAGLDIDKTLDAVRSALIESGLGFHVEQTIMLGLFKFGGFRLWKDLEESWEQIARNPLVHHLIETPKEPFVDPASDAADADLDALVSRLPIPADASQARVVAEALAGRTMVVEGPPGTGKSQTITNLIVRAIADGRRVLFVAEKQAALDVVTRRLDQVGVGDLVLNLHDRDQRPEAVRTKLRRALDLSAGPDLEGISATGTRLHADGERLRQYRHGLHDAGPTGLSYFTARTHQLAYGDGPTLSLEPQRLSAMATGEVTRLRDSLPGLGQSLWSQDAGSAGRMGYLHDAVDPRRLPGLLDAVDELRAALADVSPEVGEAARGGSVEQVELLAQALREPLITGSAVQAMQGPQWARDADALLAAVTQFETGGSEALALYRPDVLGGPLDQVRADLVDARNALFGKARKAERALAPLAPFTTGRPITDDPRELLALVDRLIALRHRVTETAGAAARVVPAMWRRWGGRWSPLDPKARAALRSAVDWHRRVAALIGAPGASPTVFQQAATRLLDAPDRTRAATAMRRCLSATQSLQDAGEGRVDVEEALAAVPVTGPREFRLKELGALNDVNASISAFRDNRLEAAVSQILGRDVDPADLASAFERGLAASALAERGHRASFDRFSPARHATAIDGYLSATGRIREELPQLLIDQALRSHRSGLETEPRMGTLRSEINRKRGRHRTIRALFGEYGDLISRITPCVLVSPDSAARFIPAGRADFDLVVFDEASQITVASAVGAMGRGRAVVVCGDSHQMPPTSFAQLVRDDEFDDDELVDEESILGECVAAQVPRHWLSWHYRSRVESLIAFSNHHYYDGRLSSFPSPLPDGRDAGPDGYGIALKRVDGEFIHSSRAGRPKGLLRTNPTEADAIVADIRARFLASPGAAPSIGVVTFNAQQRDLIETRLRDLDDPRITASLDAPDGVFVKNLENVQGDERDVILFSVAFSADENGNVPLNFGPLNRAGGERRLNVAVTRARRQVVMYVSFELEQLHAERSRSVGLHHLKDYLRAAAAGEDAVAPQGGLRDANRHTRDVAQALRAAGVAVRTDVGMSDFRIDLVLSRFEEPDVPLVAVLLDGPSWNGRETVYDRDMLPTTVLARAMGWPCVERVWMPEWLSSRDVVITRLVAAVRTARPAGVEAIAPTTEDAQPGSPSATRDHAFDKEFWEAPDVSAAPVGTVPEAMSAPQGPHSAHGLTPAAPSTPAADRAVASAASVYTAHDARVMGRLTGVTEFEPWAEHQFGEQTVLDEASLHADARSLVAQAAREICAAEFPIPARRFHYLVARAFGFTRMQPSRERQIVALLRGAGFVTDSYGFVWPSDAQPSLMSSHRRHQLDHGVRIDEIHPMELENLAADVRRREGPGTSAEGLVRSVFAELGQNSHRLTENSRRAIEEALRRSATGADESGSR